MKEGHGGMVVKTSDSGSRVGLNAMAKLHYRALPDLLRHIFIFDFLSSKTGLIMYHLSSICFAYYIFNSCKKDRKVICSKYIFIDNVKKKWSLRAFVKPCCASLNYHISVM